MGSSRLRAQVCARAKCAQESEYPRNGRKPQHAHQSDRPPAARLFATRGRAGRFCAHESQGSAISRIQGRVFIRLETWVPIGVLTTKTLIKKFGKKIRKLTYISHTGGGVYKG